MTRIPSAGRAKKQIATLCLLGSGLLLSSCGGGGAAALAGVGSGGTGLVQGLVVGFGSVFIDGKEYATTTATIQQDNDQGNPQNALLKLGDRVEATLDSTGTTVVKAMVIPSLSGPVTAAAIQDSSTGDWWTVVAGQWVRIVSKATNTPLALTTVLSGVHNSGTTLTPKLLVGNEVEVHGAWMYDASHSADVLVASRVEVLSATPLTTNVLVGGIVTVLAPVSSQVTINAVSGTVLKGTLPTGLAVGQSVSARVSRSAWNMWVAGSFTGPLAVSSINAAGLTPPASGTQNAQLSGLVSNYNQAANTATVQGTVVTLPAGARVGDGDYVKLTGQVGEGMFTSTTVNEDTQAGASVTPQSIQVLGTTNGINWGAGGTVSFVLQGTAVTAPVTTYAASCAGFAAADTVVLTVVGTVPTPGQPLVASLVTCSKVSAPPAGTVSDFSGVIQSVSAGSGSGTLTMLNEHLGLLAVNWTSTSFIDPLLGTPGSPWTGYKAEVIGTLNGTTMTATVIRLDSGGTND